MRHPDKSHRSDAAGSLRMPLFARSRSLQAQAEEVMSPSTRKITGFVLLLVLLSIALACSGERRQRRGEPTEAFTFQHDNLERTYTFYKPDGLAAGAPLLIALHGGGGDAGKAQGYYGFNPVAKEQGFAVVYPEGVDNGWNDGRGDAKQIAARENYDDAGFITALAASLVEEHDLDPKRVFLTGASNGGMMSVRLICERGDIYTAAGPVIGGIPEKMAEACKNRVPRPVIILKGTEDPLVPYEGGGVVNGERGDVLSTEEELSVWLTSAGCDPEAVTTETFDKESEDGIYTEKKAWSKGCEDAPVILYTVHGGGHTWPGNGTQYAPKAIIGLPSDDVDATKLIWAFFSRFSL